MSHSQMAEPPRNDNATDDNAPDAQRLRMARAVEANWCAAWASLGRLATSRIRWLTIRRRCFGCSRRVCRDSDEHRDALSLARAGHRRYY